jgi:hypothetical protein
MRDADRAKRALQKPKVYSPPKLRGQLEKRHQEMLRATPEAFEAFFNEFSGLKLPAHAKSWVASALGNKRLLLNVPPRHAKSTIMAQWFPIWLIARDRDIQIIIVSQTTQGPAAQAIRKISYELESNTKLNHAFGRFRPDRNDGVWRALDIQVEGKDLGKRPGLTVQIRGSMQAILGMEADWIIADDVTNPRISRSEAQRKNEDAWFREEVMSRLSPEGRAICIGQRVHVEDIYGRLARATTRAGDPSWHLETSPAVLDWETGKVLWPEEWPIHKLSDSYDSVGAASFETLYQQNPQEAGEFIRLEWIEGLGDHPGCLDHDRSWGTGWKSETQQYVPITRVMSIDPSPRMYAGIIVADVVYYPGAQVFFCSIIDIVRDKLGENRMMEKIEELRSLHSPSICVFEENSFKNISERPEWNRIVPLFRRVVYQKTANNKNDTELGIWSLAADFEMGRIRLPWANEESREKSKYLVTEALSYPNGQTTDVLMALWFIKWNFKKLMPLENLPTRFSRPWATASSWKGFERVG